MVEEQKEIKLSSKTIEDVDAVIKRVSGTVIKTFDECEAANHIFESIRLLKKKIKDDFKDNISAAFQLHKKLKAQEAEHLKPLNEAEGILKSKLGAYRREQEKFRLETERKAREEEERLRKEEEERILDEAEEAKENGASEAHVESILNQKVITETPQVEIPRKPNLDGRIFRDKWTFRIIDESLIPREFMCPDEKKIGQHVRTHKNETNIPGVGTYIDNF